MTASEEELRAAACERELGPKGGTRKAGCFGKKAALRDLEREEGRSNDRSP